VKKLKKVLNAIVDSGKFSWIMAFFFSSMFLIENKWFGKGHLNAITGNAGMLDMNFFNSPAEIFNYLQLIGEPGREAYLLLLLLDFCVIAALFLLQSTFIIRFLRRLSLYESYEWLLVLPLIRAVADIVETVVMIVNTSIYPTVFKPLMMITSSATVVKWISFWVVIGVMLSLLALNLIKMLRKKLA